MGRLSLPTPPPVEGGHRNAIGLGFGWIQTDGMKSKFFGWRGFRRGGAAASAGDSMGDRFGPGSKRWGFEFERKAKVGNGYLLIVIVMVITTVIRRVILMEGQAFEQTLIPASWLDNKSRGPHRGLFVGPSDEYRPCELARTGASELYWNPEAFPPERLTDKAPQCPRWAPSISSNHEAAWRRQWGPHQISSLGRQRFPAVPISAAGASRLFWTRRFYHPKL